MHKLKGIYNNYNLDGFVLGNHVKFAKLFPA